MGGEGDHEGEGARTDTGAGARPDHHPRCCTATAPAPRPQAWRERVPAMTRDTVPIAKQDRAARAIRAFSGNLSIYECKDRMWTPQMGNRRLNDAPARWSVAGIWVQGFGAPRFQRKTPVRLMVPLYPRCVGVDCNPVRPPTPGNQGH